MNDFLSPNSYLGEKITLFNWSAPRQACCNEEGGIEVPLHIIMLQ